MRKLLTGTITLALLVISAIEVAGQGEGSPDLLPSLEMHEIAGRHTATRLMDGTVLVVGGTAGADARPGAAEIYDPITRSFSPVGSLQVPRYGHTATLLPDGRVVILGGISESSMDATSVAEIEVYDPRTQRFEVAGRLRAPRQGHSATLLPDGRILVLGGIDFHRDEPGPVGAIEVYDPEAPGSTRVGWLRPLRWDQVVTPLADGRVLVVGLALRGDPRRFDHRTVAQLYDPLSGDSERIGLRGMDVQRETGVRLADDRVLMVGGRKPALIFDPATERFEEIPRPTTSESGTSLTLLDDGRVLVLGGEELGPATVEMFDPDTETFEQVGELHSARRGHEATKLTDGTILLTGGHGYETALRSAEVFDPDVLDVVAYGPVPPAEAAAPTPIPTPVLAPLDSTRDGGVIRMPGSGFRIRFPDEWSVEMLDPDRDYRTAEPGDTWTALRASAPRGDEKCTVAIGVVAEGANDLELDVDTDETAPEAYWRGRRKLMMPLPQVEPLGYGLSGVTGGFERRARNDPGIAHDVLYALACLSAGEDMPDAAFRRFNVLPADASDVPVGPKPAETVAPATPGPLPSLGGTVSGGRIERAGSGFAITLPEDWVVEVAVPDPDVYAAAPGTAPVNRVSTIDNRLTARMICTRSDGSQAIRSTPPRSPAAAIQGRAARSA